MRPGFSGICRFVNSISHREIRPLQSLAAGDVNNIRIGWRYGNRANRLGRLIVENRIPSSPIVVRLPYAPVHRADVEHIRLTRNARNRAGASSAEWSHHAPAHFWSRVIWTRLCRQTVPWADNDHERKNQY